MTSTDVIPAAVLKRKAVVYVRQSTQSQVMTNLRLRPLQGAPRPRRESETLSLRVGLPGWDGRHRTAQSQWPKRNRARL